jgi:hypothetical protein
LEQVFVADKKDHFDMMIDIAEEEYKIDITKNSPPEQSTILTRRTTNNNVACNLSGIDRQVYYRRIKKKIKKPKQLVLMIHQVSNQCLDLVVRNHITY